MTSPKRVGWLFLTGLALLWFSAAGPALGQSESSALSRQMRLGVRFFERGDDGQAMDQFMYVLSRGDPAEKALANEYINLITYRMSATGMPPSPQPSASPPSGIRPALPREEPAPRARPIRRPDIVVESAPITRQAAAASPVPRSPIPKEPAVRRAAPVKMRRPDKAVMRSEIRTKIKSVLDSNLKDLKDFNKKLKKRKLLLVMKSNGEPRAIGIPSKLLFKSGVSFQAWASRILGPLRGIAFSLSKAQIVILPAGTVVGDAKVLDMRRTMGISSHLFSAGIAPARVRVNLLNSQVNIPRALRDFRGIIVLFVYNKPLHLSMESSIGDEGGPPLSLGIFPASLDPEKGEGVIIEFSVMDPPAGLVSWKFQLLQPSFGAENDLVPLQQVVGGGPVFHQIYWNGRKSYFGRSLTPGRYECVLTGTDAKNRQRTLHRWIHLKGPRDSGAGAMSRDGTRSRAPSADLSGNSKPSASLVKRGRGTFQAKRRRRKSGRSRRARPRRSRAKPKSVEIGKTSARSPYRLAFESRSSQITPEGAKHLGQVAETLTLYPDENAALVGYAATDEPQAAGLAQKRAERVAEILINKHKISPQRIKVDSEVSVGAPAEVAVRFGAG